MVILNSDEKLGNDEKEKGNIHYRNKEFQKALKCYDQAIQHDPRNMTFYSNKAAVYFEQEEYEKCRGQCLTAIQVGRENRADPSLIAKALTRLGNSYFKQKSFEEAKEYFLKALGENRTTTTEEKLKSCEKEIEEQRKLAYVNPDIAIEEKNMGDKFLESGEFQSSLKYYTEAIKRNPSDATLLLSRAVPLVKLGRQHEALLDCEKCLAIDPNITNGYLCKGATLESLGRFDCAMDAYNKALAHDPNNRKALKAYYRCLDSDYQKRNYSSHVLSRALQDSELARVLSDFESETLQNKALFQKMVLEHLKDSPGDITKLVEYGLVELEN